MDKVFEEEAAYLEVVNKLIQNELKSASQKHAELASEKLSWEDRQRGQHLNNNALMDLFYRRIKKLESVISCPYFGRMDFVLNGSKEVEKYYIGKTNIVDEHQKLHTIDWRTPAAGMYYNNFLGEAFYEAPIGTIKGNILLKRQIMIENAILKKVLDADLVGRDAILQEYLDVHADNRMKNIVASIQQQQNQVIRHGINNNTIVQGIAGSGKTSVALHRIAYLMYLLNTGLNKANNVTAKQFMIIGPNTYFLDYISSVLPDLDVESANQLTLSDLVCGIVKEKITITDQSKELQDYFKSGNMNIEIGIENSAAFEMGLNKYVENLSNYYLSEDIKFLDTIIFDKDFVASFFTGRSSKFLDNVVNVQNQLIQRVKKDNGGQLDSLLTREISKQITVLPKENEQRKLLFDKRELIRAELKTGLSKTITSHFSLANKTILQHYISFVTDLEKYMTFDNMEEFKKNALKRLSKKNLSRDDIAPILLLKEKLSSVTDFTDTIHIVIDEAQDLNILEFKALKSLFPKATFSIFGDLNQSIFSYRSIKKWESVKDEVFDGDCDIFELNQSYRTTNEIMTEANKVSRFLTGNVSEEIVRHGDAVDYVKLPKEEMILCIKNLILENMDAGYKSIAIIAKTENDALRINKQLKELEIDIPNVTFDDKNYSGGVVTIASSLVKGLEFDATILADVNSDIYDTNKDIDMKLLYVAMTRALHKTSIFYTKELPSVLEADTKKYLA